MKLAIAFAIASMFGTPGIRLLRLRLRNGSGPEGWLSVFFLALAIGIPLRLHLVGNTEISAAWVQILSLLAVVSLSTAAAALIVFTRQVFRPDSGIAKWWTGVSIGVFAGSCVALFALGQLQNQIHPVSMLANLWAISAFGWTFFECIQYYTRMRRQAQIGLGDPVVQNRFLLWSVWTGSFVLLPVITFSVKVFLIATTPEGATVAASEGMMAFIRLAVLVCSASMLISIWLSFFAPEAYLARVRGTATA